MQHPSHAADALLTGQMSAGTADPLCYVNMYTLLKTPILCLWWLNSTVSTTWAPAHLDKGETHIECRTSWWMRLTMPIRTARIWYHKMRKGSEDWNMASISYHYISAIDTSPKNLMCYLVTPVSLWRYNSTQMVQLIGGDWRNAQHHQPYIKCYTKLDICCHNNDQAGVHPTHSKAHS